MRGWFWATVAGAALLLEGAVAHADCTKDTDCKGDRICSDGKCMDPAQDAAAPRTAPASPGAAPPAVAATEPQAPPTSAARVMAAEPPPAAEDQHFFDDGQRRPPKQKKRIKNPGLLTAGVIVAAGAPALLLAGVLTSRCDNLGECNNGSHMVGYVLGGLVCLGVGIPLIVVGSKREPVGHALVVPWASPNAAGVNFDLRL